MNEHTLADWCFQVWFKNRRAKFKKQRKEEAERLRRVETSLKGNKDDGGGGADRHPSSAMVEDVSSLYGLPGHTLNPANELQHARSATSSDDDDMSDGHQSPPYSGQEAHGRRIYSPIATAGVQIKGITEAEGIRNFKVTNKVSFLFFSSFKLNFAQISFLPNWNMRMWTPLKTSCLRSQSYN
jgi:hypothetical protein